MGYVEQSLGNQETLIYQADFHWSKYLAAIAPSAAGLVLAVVFSVWLATVVWWLPLVFLIIGGIGTLAEWLPLRATQMAVTNQRLIYKSGVLYRNTEELGLRAIEEINLRQTVPGRLLGYGRILANGTGGGEIHFPDLARPVQFRSAIEAARREAAVSPPTAGSRTTGTGAAPGEA